MCAIQGKLPHLSLLQLVATRLPYSSNYSETLSNQVIELRGHLSKLAIIKIPTYVYCVQSNTTTPP